VPGALPADWIDTSAITGDAAGAASAFLESEHPDGPGTGHPYGDDGMARLDTRRDAGERTFACLSRPLPASWLRARGTSAWSPYVQVPEDRE
jgi:hypothetical protein